jgi:hypothetical protein
MEFLRLLRGLQDLICESEPGNEIGEERIGQLDRGHLNESHVFRVACFVLHSADLLEGFAEWAHNQ